MFPVRVPSCVGVNVTDILQFAPTANVLPQGFVLVLSAKSPLATMLVMFSVAVPVLDIVTVFAALVVPSTWFANVSDVGVSVTTAPPLCVTVRLTVVVCVKLPDTPVMVTVDVPVAAVALAVRVNKLVEVVGFGLNPAVTPLGRPLALNVTLPLKPFTGVTVIVLVPFEPCATLSEVGFADRLKSGVLPPQPGKLKVPIAVLQSKPPSCF